MYENIRMPGLLKNIPLIMIRALPALYYYGRFANECKHAGCKQLFDQNLKFFRSAISLMQNKMGVDTPIPSLTKLNHPHNLPGQEILCAVEDLTTELSEFCTGNLMECREFYRKN